MNQLFGPLWRLRVLEGGHCVHLIFMSVGNTRTKESVLTQMINPKLVKKIRHGGCEWVVERVYGVHVVQEGRHFAGHKQLRFEVQVCASESDCGDRMIDGPDGLEFELIDGRVIEVIGCSPAEYMACDAIPHHIQLIK